MANEIGSAQPVRITVSGVLEDLKKGYTRLSSDKRYLGDGKSIQEKYNLNRSDVSRLFKHEKLKGRRTTAEKESSFVLEDDTIVSKATGKVLGKVKSVAESVPSPATVEEVKAFDVEDLKTGDEDQDNVPEAEPESTEESGEDDGESSDVEDGFDEEPEWLKD